ncbi:hypothetical protein ACWGQT_24145 [Streptomyces yangpuensis]
MCESFWPVHPGRPAAEQPVVFPGSEGEAGVVARDLADFLWLLAYGCGPYEAAAPYGADRTSRPDEALTAVAVRCAPDARSTAAAVVERAAEEFPGFDDMITELCR